MTETQKKLLAFMRAFFAENDQLPTIAATKAHFGWKSNNTVAARFYALEAKGFIEKNAVNRYRFTRTK